MKKTFLIKLIAIVVIMTFASSFSYAMMCSKCSGMMGDKQSKSKSLDEKIYYKAKMMMKNKEELGLSESQVDQIKKLKMETKNNVIRKDAEIDILAIDIKSELWEDKIDTAKTDPLIDKKYNLKKEKTKMLVSALAQLKAILTEDQLEKLKAICSMQSK